MARDEPLPSESVVSDAIGRLMEFWGFKRNMGRIWTVLYLAGSPLTAHDLRARLHLSSGAVSMTLNDLLRWGVVKKVWIQGERKDHYVAEGNLWKMISRVLRERELVEIAEAVAAMEDGLVHLDRVAREGTPEARERALQQRERLVQLLEVARLGRSLLDALLSTARLDAGPLAKFLLGVR